jgi:hypothetical protein
MSGVVNAKSAGGGRYIAACCPFCVDIGKTPDTKYHLRIEKDRYIYCYRCGFKKSYTWFIANYSINLQNQQTLLRRDTNVQATEFDVFIAQNTSKFNTDSYYSKSALNYLTKRKISPELINWLDIRLGIQRMSGRVVFVDIVNKYYMGRAFLPSVEPKTMNPSTGIRPLMYFDKFREDDLYIVEGVFDAVPFYKTNNNVCALLGKDIAKNQINQLKQTKARTIFIALDADAYDASNKLAETIANVMPTINIGICTYRNQDDQRKDPGDYDLSFFDETDIMWTRMVGMENANGK